MLRKAAPGVMLLVAASLAFGAQTAGAATERPLAEVTILPIASLTEDAAAIIAKVRILCQPNDDILWEGFLNATQGDATSFTGLPLICDGRQHVQDVVLPVDDPTVMTFERGEATASAFILDENTLDLHASDTQVVNVR